MLLLSNFTFLNKLSFLFARRQTSLIWVVQSRIDLKKIPRWRWVLTLSINVSLKIKGGELFRTFLEKIISLVLPALKLIFHLFAQLEILSRSLLMISTVSVGSSQLARREQSSAKIKISLSKPSTISFIYRVIIISCYKSY